jgi:hypothetical protein
MILPFFSASFNMSSSSLHMAKLMSLTSKAGANLYSPPSNILTSLNIVLGAGNLLTDPQVMTHP